MDARPTLQDIARIAGVGKATVSLALRDHPKISQTTRDRVKAVAEQLKYRPDPALSRIASHRWKTREHPSDFVIAFVSMMHPWTKTESLPHMRDAAAEHGEQMGYRIESFRLEEYASPAQLGRVLFHRGIRGVIIGQLFRDDFIAEFPWSSFTSIGAHVGYYQPPVTLVLPDFHHAIMQAWREVVAAGYRRIGVAMLQEMQAVDLFDKVSAALFCQARLTPELTPIPLQHFGPQGRDEFTAWLDREKPDVVLGFNDTVYWWIRDTGRAVPGDVGFVSLDVWPGERETGPNLTGMNPDYALIGRIAVEQLDLLLRTNQQGIPARPLSVHVPFQWMPGATLVAAPVGRAAGLSRPAGAGATGLGRSRREAE